MEQNNIEKPLLFIRVKDAFDRVIQNTINVCDNEIEHDNKVTQAAKKIERTAEVLSDIGNYPLTTLLTPAVIEDLIGSDDSREYRIMDALISELITNFTLFEITYKELESIVISLSMMRVNSILPQVTRDNYYTNLLSNDKNNDSTHRSNVLYLAALITLNMFANDGINTLYEMR